MSNPFSKPATASEATDTPSVSKAADDLREAAGDFTHAAEATATAKAFKIKDKAVDAAHHFREATNEKADQFRATATEKVEQFRHAATDQAQHFRDSAQEQWEGTRVKAREIHVTTEDYIRQNPTKSVLAAIGVGFLIGLITRR